MRPVNLIPPDQRRGESAPMRSGGLAYVVVAVLAVGLAAVTAVVFLNKQVADREAEVAVLTAESAELDARAESLSRYTAFQGVHDARVATVDQLARSRFDWERVLQELSLVIPRHVWLTSLSGSVAPGVGESESPVRAQITGPALELSGCGRSQGDVARLIAAMEDIDGVTRVVATDSAKGDAAAAPAPSAGGGPEVLTSDNCQTRPTIPQFNLIAAFDDVPAPAAGGEVAPVAPPVAGTEEATPATAASTPEQQEARDGVAEADRRAENAANLISGSQR